MQGAAGSSVTHLAGSRAEAQRRKVLLASVGIFSRRGFRATSMNEIAAEVGLSKPTLYHYFHNKEELLVRIYSDVLAESLDLARQTVAGAASPLDAFRDLIASRVVYTCDHQDVLRVCFEEEHELPAELESQLLPLRCEFEDILTGQIELHLAQHPDVQLGTTSKVYVNMCLGAVNWCYKWYRSDGPSTPAELGAQMAGALTSCLLPAPTIGTDPPM